MHHPPSRGARQACEEGPRCRSPAAESGSQRTTFAPVLFPMVQSSKIGEQDGDIFSNGHFSLMSDDAQRPTAETVRTSGFSDQACAPIGMLSVTAMRSRSQRSAVGMMCSSNASVIFKDSTSQLMPRPSIYPKSCASSLVLDTQPIRSGCYISFLPLHWCGRIGQYF